LALTNGERNLFCAQTTIVRPSAAKRLEAERPLLDPYSVFGPCGLLSHPLCFSSHFSPTLVYLAFDTPSARSFHPPFRSTGRRQPHIFIQDFILHLPTTNPSHRTSHRAHNPSSSATPTMSCAEPHLAPHRFPGQWLSTTCLVGFRSIL
jgi:hypothetical protein